MGKLVVTEFVSIDGVFEDPGGAESYEYGGWTFEYDRGEDGDRFKLDEVMEAQAHLLGRVTYEGFAAAWPSREGAFADKLNNDLKYVVSTTLKHPEWQNTTVISENVVEAIAKLREETGGAILVAGSGKLVGWLLANDLVDELRLMIFPTILGRGKRLFPDGIDRLKLPACQHEDGRERRRSDPDLRARVKGRGAMDQPTAEEALKQLEPLIGEWVLEAKAPDGEPWPGGGRSTFEWHDSGAHLIQRTTVELPEAPDSISIMGCDVANGTYSQQYSDERGVCRIYEMSIGDGEWKLWREGPPFPQRFTARISDDGQTIAGRWEKAEDGTNYTTDFFLTYRRAK